MKDNQGMSQVELMVVLTILSIVLTLATPSVANMLQSNQETAAINQMLGTINHARSAAVFSRRLMVLCSGDCSNSTWRGQLNIFHDANRNGRRDAGEHLDHTTQLPDELHWYWSSFRRLTHLAYEQNGTTRASNGTMTLCREGKPLRQIVISLGGRIRQRAPTLNARCG